MTVQVSLTGMVLMATPVGEYDKRLVILTKERGKITAFAKGARRQNSPLLACSQPFSFGEFFLYEGRTAYNVASASISNYFTGLRDELNSIYYGLFFCEFADAMTRENLGAKEMLKLLYQSLRALEKKTIPYPLIRIIFEWKMFALNGEAPQVFECVKCKKKEKINFFSTNNGGLFCEDCKSRIKDGAYLCGSSVYTLQYIISSGIEKLYTFTVSKEVLDQLTVVLKQYESKYIDKEFKSLEMLELLS